jgi:uncharacterized protein YjaG (DUF416 family)
MSCLLEIKQEWYVCKELLRSLRSIRKTKIRIIFARKIDVRQAAGRNNNCRIFNTT